MRTFVLSLLLAAPFTLAQARAPEPPASEVADFTGEWRAVLATRRAEQIARLRAYAEAGVFPENTTTPGLLSQLLDAHGNPCAMAHLMIASGEGPLVRRLATERNDLRFGEVTDGPVLEWVLTSGLTQEEVAFVQEPDFFVHADLDPEQRQLVVQTEVARLQSHFLAAAAQLEAYGPQRLDEAVSRLGHRAQSPPPAPRTAR